MSLVVGPVAIEWLIDGDSARGVSRVVSLHITRRCGVYEEDLRRRYGTSAGCTWS